MGLPLNQVVPNCAPNHLRLTALNQYRCEHHHHSNHHSLLRGRRQALEQAQPPALRLTQHVTDLSFCRPRIAHPQQSRNLIHINQQLLSNFKMKMAKSRSKLKEMAAKNCNYEGGYLAGHRNKLSGNFNDQDVTIRSNINKIKYFKNSIPIVSNMPWINIQNSSVLLINDSPFGLRDKRFGILHHMSPSETYYCWKSMSSINVLD